MGSEARVGMVFLLAIILTVMAAVFLTGRWGWVSGQHIALQFSNIEGLSKGSKVLFLGMEIGRVLEIRLARADELAPKEFADRRIVVDVALKRDVELLNTDQFVITQSGLLGDTHIAVRRKTAQQLAEEARILGREVEKTVPILSGARVVGDKAIGITELGDQADVILKQVSTAIEDLKAVYAGPEVRERLPAILANVQIATQQAGEFAQVLARVSVNNEVKVNRLATEMASAAAEVNKSAKRVTQLVMTSAPHVESSTSRVAQMVNATAGNMEAAAGSLQRTGARVEKLVDTTAGDLEASTKTARTTLEKTSGNIERAAQNVEKTTATVEETTRTAGQELAASAKRVRELIDGSAGNVERAAAQVEKATSAMASLAETSSKDISASTKRISDLVQKSAGDVEVASSNLAGLAQQMHGDLGAVSTRAREMVERSAADIERTTSRIAATAQTSTDDIARTTRRIHDLLATSPTPTDLSAASGHIRRAAANVEDMSKQFQDLLGDPQIGSQFKNSVANLERASGHIAAMSQESEQLVKDGRVALKKGSDLVSDEAMWANIRQTTTKLNAAMDDLQVITAHGKKLLTDPELSADLTATVKNVRAATDLGVDVVNKVDSTLGRVDQAMNKVQSISRSLQPAMTAGYMSVEAADGEGVRADLVSDLYFGETPEDYWRLGIRDFGDSEALIFQRSLGLDFGGTLRLGVFGNKLGAGFDLPVGSRWTTEFDLWNPNDPRLDVRGKFDIGSNWSLLLGANRVLSGTDAFVGFRRDLSTGGPRPARARKAGLVRSSPTAPAPATDKPKQPAANTPSQP